MENRKHWEQTDKEWARLQTLASELVPGMQHVSRYNFCLQPYDDPILRPDCVMVRAQLITKHGVLQAEAPESTRSSNKALLKLTHSDWNLYRITQTPLKALNVFGVLHWRLDLGLYRMGVSGSHDS